VVLNIFTWVMWAAFAFFSGVIILGIAQMARTGGWRDARSWTGLLILVSAAMVPLTVLGVLPALADASLIAGPLAVIGVRCWRVWRQAARSPKIGKAGATRLVVSLLWDQLRDALRNAREGVRALAARRAADDLPAAVPETASRPVRATPGVPPWRRSVPGVPSIHADPALGDAPAPADVAVALEASGVIVPRTWAAVAGEAAEFDPENEDDLCEHMDGEAAGILTWAEAVMARTENLGEGGAGLHPAYIAAHYEFADDIAELASHAAQVSKRYHLIHDDLREAADGAPLPANRFWFGDGGAPQGGRAA
jgi:hypothetical protein